MWYSHHVSHDFLQHALSEVHTWCCVPNQSAASILSPWEGHQAALSTSHHRWCWHEQLYSRTLTDWWEFPRAMTPKWNQSVRGYSHSWLLSRMLLPSTLSSEVHSPTFSPTPFYTSLCFFFLIFPKTKTVTALSYLVDLVITKGLLAVFASYTLHWILSLHLFIYSTNTEFCHVTNTGLQCPEQKVNTSECMFSDFVVCTIYK